jgi:STE24 endopeptidase
VKKQNKIKPILRLVFDISFILLKYLVLVVYILFWIKIGMADYLIKQLQLSHPNNLILPYSRVSFLLAGSCMLLVLFISFIKEILYWMIGLKKRIFITFRTNIAAILLLLPRLRKKVAPKSLQAYDPVLFKRIMAWGIKNQNDIEDIKVLHTRHYSQESNAFSFKVGKFTRVYIVDSLFDHYTHSEIEAILAHEFGHKYDLISSVNVLILRILGIFSIIIWGVIKIVSSGIMNYFSVVCLLVVIYWFFTMLWDNIVSKYREIQADTYAVLHVSNGKDLINVFYKLAEESFDLISPPGIIEFLFYSHPSPIKRINNVNAIMKAGKKRI